MRKILITGGCSFSDPRYNTWPNFLDKYLNDYSSIHTGMGSQGNGLISRKLVYEIQKCLADGIDPENMLVGVMWSGPGRYDIFSDTSPPGYNDSSNEELTLYENPTNFVRENKKKQWYIFNHHWQKTYFNATYYKLYHNEVMHQILTLEHILRLQWFFKSLNIKYFMTCYTAKVFFKPVLDHPEVKYLYDLIDLKQFLPVNGEYEWCKDVSTFEFPDPNDMHPGSEQHNDFVQKIIVPWLTENYKIMLPPI
jgi:hypothetical protein